MLITEGQARNIFHICPLYLGFYSGMDIVAFMMDTYTINLKLYFMGIAIKVKKWDITHPIGFAIIRAILGLCLATRGIYFLQNAQLLENTIRDSSLNNLNVDVPLAMIITWVHLLGGTFIILGLFTRIAVWAQIPVVIGAIIFINVKNLMFPAYADLILAIVILLLLVVFVVEGGGKFSMDYFVKRNLL